MKLYYLVRNGVPYQCYFRYATAYHYAMLDHSFVVCKEF